MEKYTNAFIHAFKTPNNFYFYDVNTNSIISVYESIYRYLNKELDYDELCKNDKNTLKCIFDRGYLKENGIEKIHHPYTEIIPDVLERKVQGIILQVTQNCNLRCKYCVYSGGYSSRGHSSKMMNYEIAKKGIDFLANHSSDMQELSVGFYGGEPLICFPLIKKVVEYSKKKLEEKKVLFHISTNATLFNEEILTFLQKNKFSVLISLDGPKEIHDQNRKFATGGGTFDTIIGHISYIKNNYHELYSRILFNAVIDPSLDSVCSNNFFISCQELDGASVQSSLISSEYKKINVTIPEKFIIQDRKEYFKIFLNKSGRLSKEYISRLSEEKFSVLYTTMFETRSKSNTLGSIMHPSGPCMPGGRKLFMSVNGDFFPCEKVSETSKITQIGSIEEGFDYGKVEKLLNVGKITVNECKNCWAIRLCSLCAVAADDTHSTELSREKKLKVCDDVRNSSEEMLKNYCTFKEYGYTFTGKERSSYEYGRQEIWKKLIL